MLEQVSACFHVFKTLTLAFNGLSDIYAFPHLMPVMNTTHFVPQNFYIIITKVLLSLLLGLDSLFLQNLEEELDNSNM